MINQCPRILFLIPYFGRWPFWMPFFLESCRHNADIDWLLFSDCPIPSNVPDNVRIESITFADYCALVSQRLNIPFAPQAAYKLCDIKPALGHIHVDRLEGTDAPADLDLRAKAAGETMPVQMQHDLRRLGLI